VADTKRFIICVPAPTDLKYEVRATSEQEALQKIHTGQGDNHPDIEYVKALDGDPEWQKAEVIEVEDD